MVNMKKHGLKRLLALLLCAVCLCGVFPSQAFAASVGQKASSWLGDQYVGSDGQHYYSPAPYTYLVYNSDGTMDVHTSSGGSAYRHYMLTDSDGVSHHVYCVESGVAYNTSDNTYTSESGTNSNYLNLLPSEARRGIVSLYDMCFDGDTDYGIGTWNEKITDSLNYLFLLKAIVKEGHTNQQD